jgi:uncharacterized membrane protein
MTGLTLLAFVMVGLFLTVAPDTLPVHYNARGEIDGWGSKYTYLLFPALTAFMGAFMGLVARYEGKQGRQDNANVVAGTGVFVLVLFDALWAFFLVKGLKGTDLNIGSDLGIKALYLLLCASLIPMGNFMPKARRNSLLGLRTKWSMADDVCWQKSQRLGGMLMVATGIVSVVLVSLLPVSWGAYALLALLQVDLFASVLGSWRIYQKEHKT